MLWLSFLLSVISLTFSLALKNDLVKRSIDLSTPAVRIEHDITIDSATTSYDFILEPRELERLSLISALDEESNSPLLVEKVIKDLATFRISNQKAFKRLRVTTILVSALEPKPSQVQQNERQFMLYTGNVMYYSKYLTVRSEVHVTRPAGELLRHTTLPEPVSIHPKKLSYGPYDNVSPLTDIPLHVHFEFSRPLLTVKHMTRLIEVSHWGNIAVEDSLEIQNDGAKLTGPFSRLDFEMGIGQKTAVSNFKSALPAAAKDIYYRDEIGNISTSTVSDVLDAVEVRLTPRFPLMGGWKTKYTLGYNVPAHEFLYRSGSKFSLTMRFIDHIYDDQMVEQLTLKIILPEMASDIQFSAPYTVEEKPREILKTYLDTVGRTVLVFEAKNLVTEHIKDFTLTYTFNMIHMLREPLMLITAFAAILLCVLVYVRLDFSIFRDEKAELQMRTQAFIDEVQEVCRLRSLVYDAYEDMIKSFKASKDMGRLSATRRNLEAENKKHNQSLLVLQGKLAELYADGAEKLKDVIQLDSSYKELVQDSVSLAERLVSGKVNKQQYQAADNEINGKKTELIARMETILESM